MCVCVCVCVCLQEKILPPAELAAISSFLRDKFAHLFGEKVIKREVRVCCVGSCMREVRWVCYMGASVQEVERRQAIEMERRREGVEASQDTFARAQSGARACTHWHARALARSP